MSEKQIERLRETLRLLEAEEESAKAAFAQASANLTEHQKLLDKAILDQVLPALVSMDKTELESCTAGLDKRAIRALNHLKEIIS